ncbi:MAG: hypothetical protein NVSMB5_13290 [Candidatus Velthaea sp.]
MLAFVFAAACVAVTVAAPILAGSPAPYPATVAVIQDSGSTNTAGYTIAVHRGGRIDVLMAHAPVTHPKIAAKLVARLYTDLARTGPVAALPAETCMKSVSFGTRLTLAYGGQQSPDLSCGESDAVRMLSADANAIVNAAHIVTRVRYGRTPPLIRESDTPSTPAPAAT